MELLQKQFMLLPNSSATQNRLLVRSSMMFPAPLCRALLTRSNIPMSELLVSTGESLLTHTSVTPMITWVALIKQERATFKIAFPGVTPDRQQLVVSFLLQINTQTAGQNPRLLKQQLTRPPIASHLLDGTSTLLKLWAHHTMLLSTHSHAIPVVISRLEALNSSSILTTDYKLNQHQLQQDLLHHKRPFQRKSLTRLPRLLLQYLNQVPCLKPKLIAIGPTIPWMRWNTNKLVFHSIEIQPPSTTTISRAKDKPEESTTVDSIWSFFSEEALKPWHHLKNEWNKNRLIWFLII